MLSTILILIAWFVPMPLWLSILTTVFMGIRVLYKIIKFIVWDVDEINKRIN